MIIVLNEINNADIYTPNIAFKYWLFTFKAPQLPISFPFIKSKNVLLQNQITLLFLFSNKTLKISLIQNFNCANFLNLQFARYCLAVVVVAKSFPIFLEIL